ncbi:MAG: hypothetical protein KDC07_01005 [Chitinophagaceae bacterium]|nr:hypothetical protein [Chitinophagaceae bacterium]
MKQLLVMNTNKNAQHNWILLTDLAQELNTHMDNIMPCLLQLKRDECLEFNKGKYRLAVNILKGEPVS